MHGLATEFYLFTFSFYPLHIRVCVVFGLKSYYLSAYFVTSMKHSNEVIIHFFQSQERGNSERSYLIISTPFYFFNGCPCQFFLTVHFFAIFFYFLFLDDRRVELKLPTKTWMLMLIFDPWYYFKLRVSTFDSIFNFLLVFNGESISGYRN